MIFAQIINGVVDSYPLSEQDVRLVYPQTALPADLTACKLIDDDGFVIVQDTAKPDYNPETQNLLETTPYKLQNAWYQNWQVVNKDPAEANAKRFQHLEYALMQKITDTVRQYHYDDIAEVGVYASTANAYQVEAQAIIVWAAACWQLFYALIEPVSGDDFLQGLPEVAL